MTKARACGLDGAHSVKWANGSTLRYHLYKRPSSRAANARDRTIFDEVLGLWTSGGCGLRLIEEADPDKAEIRVMFNHARGRWSMLGAEALDITNSKEPTMNFDSHLDSTDGLLAALHEVGHMFGFRHEHQTPDTPLRWREDAVIAHYKSMSGWSADYTRRNVIHRHDMARKSPHPWDPESIMHYGVAPGLIAAPADWKDKKIPAPTGLSAGDRAELLAWYPPL
ncbi:M12 family metallopeptidase [Maricaulis maris]|uniref:Astacin (Peptidase family M12A) n=1 Tax=Maricaulis maris TaxID=74318 RepID=A0A495DM14_9PROT|nr:M12 family metallopeptidase [Maricaulis maris]RKR03956.1 astacin (peptidase family M12A) [Maricaulis maris]